MPIIEKCFKITCDNKATHVCRRDSNGGDVGLKNYIELYVCENHVELFRGSDNDMWTIKRIDVKEID